MVQAATPVHAGDHRCAPYAWVITVDELEEAGSPRSRIGRCGPRDASEVLLRRVRGGDGHAFRMLDDDGEVIYRGRYVSVPDDLGFGPLDDFGEPDAGCTSIEYRERGRWEAL